MIEHIQATFKHTVLFIMLYVYVQRMFFLSCRGYSFVNIVANIRINVNGSIISNSISPIFGALTIINDFAEKRYSANAQKGSYNARWVNISPAIEKTHASRDVAIFSTDQAEGFGCGITVRNFTNTNKRNVTQPGIPSWKTRRSLGQMPMSEGDAKYWLV